MSALGSDENLIACGHLRRGETEQAEAVLDLDTADDAGPAGVILCPLCWLRVQGAVLAEMAQAAIAGVVRKDGLAALAVKGNPG